VVRRLPVVRRAVMRWSTMRTMGRWRASTEWRRAVREPVVRWAPRVVRVCVVAMGMIAVVRKLMRLLARFPVLRVLRVLPTMAFAVEMARRTFVYVLNTDNFFVDCRGGVAYFLVDGFNHAQEAATVGSTTSVR
jgi:hypothetical protein